jgi:hypothetical protein
MNITRYGLAVLSVALFMMAGCATPNALVGWKQLLTRGDNEKLEKALRADAVNYMETVVGKDRAAGPSWFYEDGSGQHAIGMEVFQKHENASWEYLIIYSKENKRVKVIKYGYRRYQS